MAVTKISWLLPPSKLKLSTNDVHVWRVRLNQTDGRVQQLQKLLSDDERLRAERFHFDRDRRRFIVSQGTLRMIIGDYIDMEPSRLQFHSGHRGKPYITYSFGDDPLQFNLAHSKEIALYAFTLSREIGIDLEYVRDMPDAEKIALTTFSPLENETLQSLPQYQRQEAFFNCWVRKEAFIKAIGDGLYHALDRFDVSLAPGEPARLVSVEGSAEQTSCWFMKSLTPEDGYVAALAVKGSDFCPSYWKYPEKN
ncbi:MAG: 4'-phosphopantetheinyl transferase superfamily protein [Proteobacteria bacterium]|nr:4'-phosphopantetheinyl transferase superfamily protein [Pseudomonadota bacterium]